MKKSIFLLFVLGLQFITAQSIKIDAQNSKITFEFVSKKVKGSFSDIKGTIKSTTKDLTNAMISGSVAVNTIETGNFLRDGHLMWKKYFYQKKHPRIYFESSSITKNNETYLAMGMFTIKGISKATEITFKIKNNILYGEAKVNSANFDINIDSDKEDNVVLIHLEFPLL